MVDIAGGLEDNVSDSGSVVSGLSNLSNSKSKRSSTSKTSKSSKLTKKSKNKIAKRNVKEGSPLEEEFLITILQELKLAEEDLENLRELVRVLNFVKNSAVADELSTTLNIYVENVNSTVKSLLSVPQQDFINAHPEIKDLFPSLNLNDIVNKEKGTKIFKTTSG
jgi:elongator complex protein 1